MTTDDKLKHIGHSLTRSGEVECGEVDDKLKKHIGHSLSHSGLIEW